MLVAVAAAATRHHHRQHVQASRLRALLAGLGRHRPGVKAGMHFKVGRLQFQVSLMKQQRRIRACTYTHRLPMTPGAQRNRRYGHDIAAMPPRADLLSMLRHDANRITGRHSDIRCTATIESRASAEAAGRAPGARIACSSRCSCHVLQVSGARAVQQHGHTRLEGMISMINERGLLLQGWSHADQASSMLGSTAFL